MLRPVGKTSGVRNQIAAGDRPDEAAVEGVNEGREFMLLAEETGRRPAQTFEESPR